MVYTCTYIILFSQMYQNREDLCMGYILNISLFNFKMFAPSCGICFSRKDVRKLTTTAESLCNIPNNLLPKIEQTREVKFFFKCTYNRNNR